MYFRVLISALLVLWSSLHWVPPGLAPQAQQQLLISYSSASASWGSIIQHPKGSSATHTCTVTLSATGSTSAAFVVLLTHNLFTTVGQAMTFVSGTDSAGEVLTPVPSSWAQFWDGSAFVWYNIAIAWIPHVATGVTTISATTQNTIGTLTSICYGIEASYSGGTPTLDAGTPLSTTTCTNCAGAVPTLTGKNLLGIQTINITGTPSAITGGAFTSPAFSDFDVTYAHSGISVAINTTSTTVPTWTNTAGPGTRAGVYFGFTTTACVDYSVEDFSGGVATNVPTNATLLGNGTTTGVLGDFGSAWNNSTGTAFVITGSNVKYQTITAPVMTNIPRFCSGGVTYPNTSTLAMQYSSTGATTSFITYQTPNQATGIPTGQMATTIYFRTNYVGGSDALTLEDIFFPHGVTNGFIGLAVRISGGLLQLCFEGDAGGSFGPGSNCTTISSSTWYQLATVVQITATATATFSNGSANITAANTLDVGSVVFFSTSGALPTNFAINTGYYVTQSGATFQVAATPGGAPIVAGSAGSGTQTMVPGHQAAIFDSTGAQVGSTFVSPYSSGASYVGNIAIGPSTAFTGTTARTMDFGELKVCQANGALKCTTFIKE